MKKVLVAAKSGSMDRRLNSTVTALLGAFWQPEELAKFSRTGRPCPSIPGKQGKDKFPDVIMDAIISNFKKERKDVLLLTRFLKGFLIHRWPKWNPGSKEISKGDVKASIGTRLLACHTSLLKKLKKNPNLATSNAADNLTAESDEEQS